MDSNIEHFIDKVFCKDIFELLDELPKKSVDCILGDPDYNVGISYNGRRYTRKFSEYIKWYIELAKKSLSVLKETGNMFLINYPKQNAFLWGKFLEEVCYDVQEYVWIYNTNVGHTPRRFTTAHRSILHCMLSKDNKFYKDNVAVPYENPNDKRIKRRLAQGSKGRMPYSWFYFNLVKNVSKEKTYHSCQLPQKMTEMLIKSCTEENDIVLILFGGSGAELDVCKNINRRYISAEIDPKYYNMIIDRLTEGEINDKYKLQLKKD